MKLQIVASNYANSYSRMEEELKTIKEQIVELHKKREYTLQNTAYVRNLNTDDFKRDHALTKNILSIDMLFSEQSEKELFSFVGFKVLLPNTQSEKKPYVVLARLGVSYTVEMGDKAIGNKRRITNFIKKLDDVIKEIEKQIVKFEKVKIDYEGELVGKISFESQKVDLEDEIAILEAKI